MSRAGPDPSCPAHAGRRSRAGNKSGLPRAVPLFGLAASLDGQDPLGVGEVVLQERVLGVAGRTLGGWAEPRPWAPFYRPSLPPPTPTHVKGFTKGIVAAKDGVGDRDQGGAGPFLPGGEVLLSIAFRLRREVTGEGPRARSVDPAPPPPPPAQPYLEGGEAKACGLASSTEVEGSSHQAKQCSSSHHSPHTCHHRWGLRCHHRPLQARKVSKPDRPRLSPHPLLFCLLSSPPPTNSQAVGVPGEAWPERG